MEVELNALATFVEANLDCNELYEDDSFAFDFQGQRIYCERKRRHFNLHVGKEVFQMPRC